MMRKPSTGLLAVEIALRTAFSALSVRLIIARPSLTGTIEQAVRKTYAMLQFIDKTSLCGIRLSPLRRVSGFRQGGFAPQTRSMGCPMNGSADNQPFPHADAAPRKPADNLHNGSGRRRRAADLSDTGEYFHDHDRDDRADDREDGPWPARSGGTPAQRRAQEPDAEARPA